MIGNLCYLSPCAEENAEKWDEAITECKRALKRNPDHYPALHVMASACGLAGRLDEGRAVVSQILKINPNASVGTSAGAYKYKADIEMYRDGLRKVGYPEKSAQQ